MPDTQLQIELAEARREILRLRERVSVGAPTVHKDLSLVSLVPKFSDSDSEVPLEEFISYRKENIVSIKKSSRSR